MKNLKIYDKNFRNKLGALGISVVMGVTFVGFTGCSNNSCDNDSAVYTVEKTNFERYDDKYFDILKNGASKFSDVCDNKYALYDRIIDMRKVQEASGTDGVCYPYYDCVYPVKSANLTSPHFGVGVVDGVIGVAKGYDVLGGAWFNGNKLIVPDSYMWASKILKVPFPNYESPKFVASLKYDELRGCVSGKYLSYEYELTAKEDINYFDYLPEAKKLKNDNSVLNIHEGDSICYKALYHVDSETGKLVLVADTQTGIGSDDKNVKDSLTGDYDEVVMSINVIEKNGKDREFDDSNDVYKYVNEQMSARKIR